MLAVHGRACNVHRNTEEYENSEHMKVMMPWNGDAANLIDRFDARANLDMYREPPATRPKLSDADKEIEEVSTASPGSPSSQPVYGLFGDPAAS